MSFRKLLNVAICFSFLLRPACAAEDAWLFDVDRAQRVAETDDKLLVVVQFDNDFLKSTRNSKEFESYARCVVDSAQNKRLLKEHAVLTCESVGRPGNLVWEGRKQSPSVPANSGQFGNAITWLCRPDGTVLSLLVGYPDSPSFLHSKVKECKEAIKHAGDPTNLQQLKLWHLDQVTPEDQRLYQKFYANNRRRKKTKKASPLSAAVLSLVETWHHRVEQRFGANWNKQQVRNLTNALAGHASVEHQLSHLLLAELPEVHYRSLQQDVWQGFANIGIWAPDRPSLGRWVQAAKANSNPILLRVVGRNGNFPSWPTSDFAEELMNRSTRRDVSLADLAFVANKLNAGMIKIPRNAYPTFFMSAGAGQPFRLLTQSDSRSELTKQLVQINAANEKGK